MAIGVQNTSAALLALQTLNRLKDPTQSSQASAASATEAGPDASPSVIADSGAQTLSLDNLGAVTAGLNRASSITDSALSAGQSVSDLLSQMQSLVSGGGASGPDVSANLSSLLNQLSATVSGAGFDGVNLLDGSSGSSVTVGAGSSGAVTLNAQNLSLGGPVITVGADATATTQTAAATVLNDIETSIANLSAALDQIGNQSQQLQAHASFVSRLSDVVAQGAGSSTSAPTSADGARLMALQIQQQLAAQGGSIANSNPQVLLSLFK